MKRVRVQQCSRPNIKLPKLLCDDEIHKRLNEFELSTLMNRSFACLICGKAGSGKTSLLVGLLTSKQLFRKCFDQVFVFMPPNSRASLKDSVFDELPEDQLYDTLDLDSLQTVFGQVEANSKEHRRSLIIFDDVQQFFKGKCEKLINHMVHNRRHNRLSIFFVAQTYKKVPRSVRLGVSDLFCFRLSRSDMDDIHKELVDMNDKSWESVLGLYQQKLKQEIRTFLYLNVSSGKIFFDWENEIKYDETDEKDDS